ncbi:MAG: hypothetical protein K0Q49_1905 [Haloplasmataceae bacterium]|nr:hypothetical protein [Haloplasmataceae bacterium]
MTDFKSFYGVITMIDEFWTGNPQEDGCYKLMSMQDNEGNVVNFVVTPNTYFVDHFMINIGDVVVGYYDANAPVPLIYPPQYRAIVVTRVSQLTNVKVDYFNEQLLSSDGSLRLNISLYTQIIQENGQVFTGNPANHNLIVTYGATTRSIPAQTTPIRIIVMCR